MKYNTHLSIKNIKQLPVVNGKLSLRHEAPVKVNMVIAAW